MMSEDTDKSTPKKEFSRDAVEAINLLAQGKRNMMCGEVAHAVNQLQEACQILDKEYGDGADECADAYFWYGKALLEMSRLEGGVLGDAVPGDLSSQSSEEDEEEEEAAAADGNASASDGTEDAEEDGAQSEDLENEEEADENKPPEESPADKEPVAGPSDAGAETATRPEQEEEDLDDVSNLQLAWEMIELAKVIYTKHESKGMQLKLADTYLKLGEIGMETEQYNQAISDLVSCLDIQQKYLSEDDRLLAETHYQLGLACMFDKRYSDAIRYYRSAIDVMKAKIKHLNRIVSGELPPDPSMDTDGFDTPQQLAQKEIDELASILPDIEAKIEDVEDEQRNAEQVTRLMKESVTPTGAACSVVPESSSSAETSSAFSSSSSLFQSFTGFSALSSSSVQPVNNISHLVRKKRKTDNETADVDVGKKPKTVTTTLVGDSTTTEQMNGQNGDLTAKDLDTAASSSTAT